MEKKKTISVLRNSSAKINLFLDVISVRLDGYHEIRTIFSEIDLYDVLNFTLTKNSAIKILANIDFVSLEKNLIYKVAIFIQKKYNVLNGAKIELQKNIPIAAGLGGGSSNAAQTILALNVIWKLNLSTIEMNSIAARFGSDINFFLSGGTALGEGRGEEIKRLDDLEIENILLVNPGFEISSKEAYEAVNVVKPNSNWKEFLRNKDVNFCFNKLEEGVIRLYPKISKTLNFMQENGAMKAMLSGSGATMIGFCPDRATAENLSEYFTRKKYWNCITKTIKRSTK